MEPDPSREQEQRQREQQAEHGLRRAVHGSGNRPNGSATVRGALTPGRRKVDSIGVDVAARFREYVRLDRQRRSGSLSLPEMQRFQELRRFLSIHFAPDRPEAVSELRDSVRVPIRIKVSFAADREPANCMMTTLSRGGAFVQSDHPFELKTVFTLMIHVESPPRDIAVPVEVVSVGVGPACAREKRGMGLRFLEMSPDVEKQLDELYENAVK
jgi:Tfp pilus assembly protein PilZ